MTGDFQIGNPAGYPLIGTGCEYCRDIRLLFYCPGVMINDTGLLHVVLSQTAGGWLYDIPNGDL